mgnify:CR=1 FL=1
MRVFGYVRVSTNRQIDNSSCAAQAEAIVRRFPDVAEVFQDDGVSGSIPLFERPAGKALRDQLRPGDTLVISKLDRGFRSTEDFLTTFRHLSDEGIDIAVLALGGGDPIGSNPIAKALVSMLAVFGELERSMILERTTEGRAAASSEGRHIGGKVPFGYTLGGDGKLIEEPWRSVAIQYIKSLRDQDYSYRAIASAVTEHYAPASHATIDKLIKSEKMYG